MRWASRSLGAVSYTHLHFYAEGAVFICPPLDELLGVVWVVAKAAHVIAPVDDVLEEWEI